MFMNAARTLRVHCVDGITANQDVCREYIERSIGVVTALNPVLGYDATTELAKEALETGRGIVELVREKGLLTEEEIAAVMDPENMTGSPRKWQSKNHSSGLISSSAMIWPLPASPPTMFSFGTYQSSKEIS